MKGVVCAWCVPAGHDEHKTNRKKHVLFVETPCCAYNTCL